MRNAIRDKPIFLLVDESNLSGIQCLNVLVGNLETSHISYLYECQAFLCARNSNSIAQGVDDAVKSLGIARNSMFYCLMPQNM